MLERGTRIGPYEVLGALGAGGMGEVYRARDRRLGREIALKVLRPDLLANPTLVARFEREARAASALNHPGVVTVHDVGRDGDLLYLAMELIDGRSLRQILAQERLAVRRVLLLAAQLADGLAAAHERGVVHRDLKPENVMVTADGMAKILDFGVAKPAGPLAGAGTGTLDDRDAGTRPGVLLGTIGYMAPEQARGEATDHRSDQFAFGAVVYELLAGRAPFWRPSEAETLSALLRDDPAPLVTTAAEGTVPLPLRWIVERCLAKDPEERWDSTRDLAREVASVRDHLGDLEGARPLARDAARPRRARARGPLLLAAALLVGAACGAGLGRLLGPRRAAPTPTLRSITYSGRDHSPSVSPDGRLVVFASARDGRSRVWLKQLPSGAEVALTAGPDTLPRLSPDGTFVLFSRAEAGRTALYRVPVLGGEPRKLLDDATEGAWSPDGQRVAFVTLGQDGETLLSTLGVAGADGSDRRTLLRAPSKIMRAPRFSPDGRAVAVVETSNQFDGGDVVEVVAVADASRRRLVPPEPRGLVSSALWERDGRALLYLQNEEGLSRARAGSAQLVRHPVQGGGAEALLWLPVFGPRIDAGGPGRLVIGSSARRQNLRELGTDAPEPPPGARWLTRGWSLDRQPSYSPDGERVVFSSDRSGNLDVWELTLRTGALRRLTDHDADDWDPSFTPDGKHLLFSSRRGGHYEVWLADADGVGARQVTHDGVDAENPTMTPDGQWIVYASFNPARRGLWRVRPDGTEARRLNPTAGLPQLSPDGQHVLYRVVLGPDAVAVQVARLEDGEKVPFEIRLAGPSTNAVSGIFVGRARWMPDGRAIAFVAEDERGVAGVFVQPFAPGRDTSAERRRLAGFDPDAPTESFAVSPQGRVLVSSLELANSLVLAERVAGLAVAASGGPR